MLLSEIKSCLEEASNPGIAPAMEAYMKNNFKFLGIKKPIRKDLLKIYFDEIKKLNADDTLTIAKELWALPEREFQYTSIEILMKAKKKWNDSYFDFFEKMIIEKSWWDSVDTVASRLIGEFILANRAQYEWKMREYAIDENMWKRRTSIIYQLFFREDVSVEILFDHILKNKDDKQFFIQKAIGWALRQISRTHSELVIEFVETHEIKGLARREALRLIS